MKKLLILLIVALFSGGVFAQEKEKGIVIDREAKNAIYFEMFGNGICMTLNYERFIKRNMSVRAGVGTALLYALATPIMFNFFVGQKYRLELGIGVTIFCSQLRMGNNTFGNEKMIAITSTVGYRYQPVDGGPIFKIGFTPFYLFESSGGFNKNIFFPFFGFSFGGSF
jgi:hypothetical protein